MWNIKYIYITGYLSNKKYGVHETKLERQLVLMAMYKIHYMEFCIHYFNDKKHRRDGPAMLTYSDSHTSQEIYYINDKIHNAEWPANIYSGNLLKIQQHNGVGQHEKPNCYIYYHNNIRVYKSDIYEKLPDRPINNQYRHLIPNKKSSCCVVV